MFNFGGKKAKELGEYGLSALMPFTSVKVVTPSDVADNCVGYRGLWVGTAGTANFTTADGDEVTDFPLQVGYNPLLITRLKTGGTASDIWACK